jgi:hypothetical protein
MEMQARGVVKNCETAEHDLLYESVFNVLFVYCRMCGECDDAMRK